MDKLLAPNVGQTDRIVRVVGGIALLSLLAIGPVPGWGLVGLLGLVLLATAAMRSCPIYSVLGVRTDGTEQPS